MHARLKKSFVTRLLVHEMEKTQLPVAFEPFDALANLAQLDKAIHVRDPVRLGESSVHLARELLDDLGEDG